MTTSGLGIVNVIGRMRVPSPAASTKARCGMDEPEVGMSEVGMSEVGMSEVGMSEVGMSEVGMSEVGMSEVEMGAALKSSSEN
jgi:hypothetical protein